EPEADGHLVPQVVPALIRLDPNLQLPRFGLDDDPQGEQLILLRLRAPHAPPPPGHHQREEEEKLHAPPAPDLAQRSSCPPPPHPFPPPHPLTLPAAGPTHPPWAGSRGPSKQRNGARPRE